VTAGKYFNIVYNMTECKECFNTHQRMLSTSSK